MLELSKSQENLNDFPGLRHADEIHILHWPNVSFPPQVTILTELSELQLLALKQVSALSLQGLIEESKTLKIPDSNLTSAPSLLKPKTALLWWQRVIGKKEKPTFSNRPKKPRGGKLGIR